MQNITPYKTVTSIFKKYDTEGHSPYLVLTDDFDRYVLKTPNNQYDINSIIKEFVCIYLLQNWDIASPEVASLKLDDDLKTSEYYLNDKSFLFSNVYFGSKYLDNSIDLQEFFSLYNKTNSRKIINSDQLYKIALFDIWIENDDRKPSNNNILLSPTQEGLLIIPIDHAFTFATQSFNSLDSKYVSFSDYDSILYSSFGKSILIQQKINNDWFSNAKDYFYLCIDKTKESFQHICNNVPSELNWLLHEKEKLYDFLFSKERNKKVLEQFTYIIQDLKK